LKSSEKKIGRNWGTVKDDEATLQAKPETTEGGDAEATPAAAAGESAPVEVPEEEGPKQLTLDEFRRQQQERRNQLSLPAARKAGEGEDASRWGQAQELVKEDEGSDAQNSAERKNQRAFKKQTVEINVQFQAEESSSAPRDNSRGRGRGGSRGGPSRGGRGGRGGRTSGPRPDSKGQSASFQVSDSDFPSL